MPAGWRLRSRLRATASRVAPTAAMRNGVRVGRTKVGDGALCGKWVEDILGVR